MITIYMFLYQTDSRVKYKGQRTKGTCPAGPVPYSELCQKGKYVTSPYIPLTLSPWSLFPCHPSAKEFRKLSIGSRAFCTPHKIGVWLAKKKGRVDIGGHLAMAVTSSLEIYPSDLFSAMHNNMCKGAHGSKNLAIILMTIN